MKGSVDLIDAAIVFAGAYYRLTRRLVAQEAKRPAQVRWTVHMGVDCRYERTLQGSHLATMGVFTKQIGDSVDCDTMTLARVVWVNGLMDDVQWSLLGLYLFPILWLISVARTLW